jgi:ribosome-associated protein
MPTPELIFGGVNPEKNDALKTEAAADRPSDTDPAAESHDSPSPTNREKAESSADGRQTAVPEREIEIDFVRSSGPGGQNVNKVSSKAQLRWRVGDSAAFNDHQKDLIRRAAGNRLNAADEIVLSEQSERSQPRNREEAIARLQRLVTEALTPRKVRKPTKPSRAAKERRLEEKRRQGEKKQGRREPKGGW